VLMAAIGVLMVLAAGRLLQDRKGSYPYHKNKALFTAAERSFLGA
jgi:hypothetical protein